MRRNTAGGHPGSRASDPLSPGRAAERASSEDERSMSGVVWSPIGDVSFPSPLLLAPACCKSKLRSVEI